MPFHTVAQVGELEPGDIKPVVLDGAHIILYRVDDAYYASQRQCLHQGGDLADGLISRGFLICPYHGWQFHADTGMHELSPETCLRTYAVRIEGNDIQIDPTPRLHYTGENS